MLVSSQDLIKELILAQPWFRRDSENQVHLETSDHPHPQTPLRMESHTHEEFGKHRSMIDSHPPSWHTRTWKPLGLLFITFSSNLPVWTPWWNVFMTIPLYFSAAFDLGHLQLLSDLSIKNSQIASQLYRKQSPSTKSDVPGGWGTFVIP